MWPRLEPSEMGLGSTAAAAVLAVVIAIAPVRAAAEDAAPDRVAIIPFGGTEELDPHWKAMFEEQLYAGVSRAGRSPIAAGEVADQAATPEMCASPTCFAALGATLSAPYLISTRVHHADRDFDFTLRLVDGTTGATLFSSQPHCQMCGEAEAADLLADEVGRLLGRLDGSTPPRLEVITVPAGALVTVDGQLRGKSPLRTDVTVGEHDVEVTRPGHETRAARVTSTAGVEETLRFELTPGIARSTAARTWGWASVAAGIASTVAGAVLIGLDARPYRAQCSGDNVDAEDRCRFRYDTLAGGVVLVVAGVGLVTTGVVFVLRNRARSRAAGPSTARWSPAGWRF